MLHGVMAKSISIDYNDPLVGADHEMTMGATCLYTWCVNLTPQVWVSECHGGVVTSRVLQKHS